MGDKCWSVSLTLMMFLAIRPFLDTLWMPGDERNCLTEEGHSLAEGLTLASVSRGEALLPASLGRNGCLPVGSGRT